MEFLNFQHKVKSTKHVDLSEKKPFAAYNVNSVAFEMFKVAFQPLYRHVHRKNL